MTTAGMYLYVCRCVRELKVGVRDTESVWRLPGGVCNVGGFTYVEVGVGDGQGAGAQLDDLLATTRPM